MKNFAHLHCHSEYSFIPGAPEVDELCRRVYELGMRSLALTDSGNMCAALKFYDACKRLGIKPILGCELSIRNSGSLEASNDNAGTILVLAQNNAGYGNLIKLASFSRPPWQRDFKTGIDQNILPSHSDGLICLSGSLSGLIPQAILLGEKDKARNL